MKKIKEIWKKYKEDIVTFIFTLYVLILFILIFYEFVVHSPLINFR